MSLAAVGDLNWARTVSLVPFLFALVTEPGPPFILYVVRYQTLYALQLPRSDGSGQLNSPRTGSFPPES